MKTPVAICLMMVALWGGQATSRVPEEKEYRTQSNMLVLRFAPKDNKAKIFLLGNKVANLDFNKDAKLLSVVLQDKQRRETLKLNGAGDLYEVESAKHFPSEYKIIFNAQIRGRPEELILRVKNPKKP